MTEIRSDAPVGIFDSGIGGLSVARHFLTQLPAESLLYLADSANAPYGDRDTVWLTERSVAIAEYLFHQGAKALVVACNTATAAAIRAIRAQFPQHIVIGMEPGLKPATILTKSGHIGVLATSATLRSEKFALLCKQLSGADIHWHLQACPGLVEQIERGELDSDETLNMLRGYLQNMVSAGVDSIVLGCTHYPFLADQIKSVWRTLSDTPPQLIDTGEAVIRHLRNSLQQAQLLQTALHTPEIRWLSTGNPANLQATLQFLLPGTEHRCTQAVSI